MAVIAENLYAPEMVPFVQSLDEALTEPVALGLHRKHGLARLAAGLLFALSPVSYRAFLPQAKAQFYAEAPMSMQPERLVGPGDELNIMTYNIKSGELGIDGIAHVVQVYRHGSSLGGNLPIPHSEEVDIGALFDFALAEIENFGRLVDFDCECS